MKKVVVQFVPCILLFAYSTFSQNVGIGTTTPTRAKLEVHGSVNSTSAIFGGESTGISIQSNWPGIGFNEYAGNGFRYIANGYGAIQYLDPTSGYMTFAMLPNGIKDAVGTPNTAMIISNTGNVGIRTNPINASLYVVKAGNSDGAAVFGGSLYNSHFAYGTEEHTYIRGGRNGSKVFINDLSGGQVVMGNGNGLVGINNGVPVYPLEIRQVNGRGIALVEPANSFNYWEYRLEEFPSSGQSNINMIYNGQYKGFFHFSTGNYTVYSDSRLKTDIESIQPVLDKFMQLEPVDYDMKYPGPEHDKTVGFIAQDVKQLFPDLVNVTSDTGRGQKIPDLHAINYDGFSVLTIKAIQEQQEIIKRMKQQNKELAERIRLAEAFINDKK